MSKQFRMEAQTIGCSEPATAVPADRSPAEQPVWYCVQSHPNQEQRAAQNLERLEIPILFPRYLGRRSNGYQVHECPMALFPTYLFAQFNLAELWRRISRTHGVRSIVSLSGKALSVPEDVVAEIQARIGPNGYVELYEPITQSNHVRVVMGAFSGLEGVFVRNASARDRVWVLLRFLERETMLEFDREAVRAI